jgi:S-(hydroxymethyl)glutathione dehydrogenase/alcohol dehydrogenase
MKTTAAVLLETGKPLVLADLEIPALKPGQTLVEIAYSGVCHTQLLECRGHRGEDRFLPHCLGHEGSGTVRDVGPGVNKVAPGDKVILSWMKGTGGNVPGTAYSMAGQTVNSGAITTFSHYSVISENRLTKIAEKLPLREAALLGCAVPTGLGSVINTAAIQAGQTVVVFGTGGVGLFAVAGAALSNAAKIIAVDILASKLELAKEMGATDTIDASQADSGTKIRELLPQGADIAIEATGNPQVMAQALSVVRQQGGKAVIIGNAKHGAMLQIDPQQLNQGKQLLGTWGGDNDPDHAFPKYIEFAASGKLQLAPLISKTYALGDVNTAIDDLEAGRTPRPLIDMSLTDS